MTRLRSVASACALAVATLIFFAVVGMLNPLPKPHVDTDTLGPDNGETVDEYIARALSSVRDASSGDDVHWGLVSFAAPLAPRDALLAVSDARIAQVLFRVPMERVQTPVVSIGVSGSERSVLASEDDAASRLRGSTGQWDRQSQIDAASSARLTAGCDCVVGLVVRATGRTLQSVMDAPGVRAVEALPADAVAGRFAVRALLAEYTDVVGPLPDDGPIPPP